MAQARVVFTVNGVPVPVNANVPNRRARLDELLPVLREIDNQLIDVAVTAVEAQGEQISCAKGCSACCRRQPVPVTPPEAFALALLVEALPEPRRAAVRAVFAAAVDRLHEAGLYDVYMQRDPDTTREGAMVIVRRYMALALTCPFLEDDACSIHAVRPFVCRQYLVTSPPALCDAPLDKPVKPLRAPAAFATAMLRTAEALSGQAQYTIPLVLALDYAQAHRAELERSFDAKAAFTQIVRALAD